MNASTSWRGRRSRPGSVSFSFAAIRRLGGFLREPRHRSSLRASRGPLLAELIQAGDGLQPRVDLELAEDVLDVVSHRGFADEKLFRDGRRGRASPHQGHDLQLPRSQFTAEGQGPLARREFALSQLLANKYLNLVCHSDIAKEVDHRRRLACTGG